MTGLRKRVFRLETQKAPVEPSNARDRLAAMLARMEVAVLESGDISDRPGASPFERTVRRYLRREVDMGTALRDAVARRWP